MPKLSSWSWNEQLKICLKYHTLLRTHLVWKFQQLILREEIRRVFQSQLLPSWGFAVSRLVSTCLGIKAGLSPCKAGAKCHPNSSNTYGLIYLRAWRLYINPPGHNGASWFALAAISRLSNESTINAVREEEDHLEELKGAYHQLGYCFLVWQAAKGPVEWCDPGQASLGLVVSEA